MGQFVYEFFAIALIFGTLALKFWTIMDNSRKEKESPAPKYTFNFIPNWTLGILDLMGVFYILTHWEMVWSKVQHLFVMLP
jgi:hypothetical protein